MDYNSDVTYVLTAPRCRPSWRELYGNMPVTKSKRFRRGDKIVGIPEEQIARLVELGHAVPEDDWNPEEFRKMSANRRLAMNQAAAADMASAVANAKASSGQPLVGLEDAPAPAPAKPEGEAHEVDGIKVEDVEDLATGDTDDAADLASITPGVGDDSDTDTGEASDRYTDMSYPDLQREAKDKTGNGGGSAPELRDRLREHDAK